MTGVHDEQNPFINPGSSNPADNAHGIGAPAEEARMGAPVEANVSYANDDNGKTDNVAKRRKLVHNTAAEGLVEDETEHRVEPADLLPRLQVSAPQSVTILSIV